jgi:hypothetical protein
MKREVVKASGAPTPMAHYCQGVLAGDVLFRLCSALMHEAKTTLVMVLVPFISNSPTGHSRFHEERDGSARR